MCGIVAGISTENISEVLINGLTYLEYRGYDSAGIAFIHDHTLQTVKQVGKVKNLANKLSGCPTYNLGIAHTRWATHGKPTSANTHPHTAGDRIAIVHNGIIENHVALRRQLEDAGHIFTSETDSEVISALILHHIQKGLNTEQAFKVAVSALAGSFAIVAIDALEPQTLYAITKDSPLVIGIGAHGHFLASDQIALLSLTSAFIFLPNQTYTTLTSDAVVLSDMAGNVIVPEIRSTQFISNTHNLGRFKHYMHKEIHEQADITRETVQRLFTQTQHNPDLETLLRETKRIKLVACGTSYHAAIVAKYWLESISKIATTVEIASEYRYQPGVSDHDTLFICLSQSGETADTLAALRFAKTQSYLSTLAICNNAHSSIVRESEHFLLLQAGKEIGVASTKAFTAQLFALLYITLTKTRLDGNNTKLVHDIECALAELPQHVQTILQQEAAIQKLARRIIPAKHVLFLGRNNQYPIAQEGALKLKEISYIDANAYAAGELKHGPLALVDRNTLIIYLLPDNHLIQKNLSNLAEIEARGGQVLCIAEHGVDTHNFHAIDVLSVPKSHLHLTPILMNIPLQLLAYYVALGKGNDIDQPRNLAKSVTVE